MRNISDTPALVVGQTATQSLSTSLDAFLSLPRVSTICQQLTMPHIVHYGCPRNTRSRDAPSFRKRRERHSLPPITPILNCWILALRVKAIEEIEKAFFSGAALTVATRLKKQRYPCLLQVVSCYRHKLEKTSKMDSGGSFGHLQISIIQHIVNDKDIRTVGGNPGRYNSCCTKGSDQPKQYAGFTVPGYFCRNLPATTVSYGIALFTSTNY